MERVTTVIIPTYKRPNCIKDLLIKSINPYHGNLLKFEIHDSSPDSKTNQIVSSLAKSDFLTYFRYSPTLPADEKVIQSIKKVDTDVYPILGPLVRKKGWPS